MHLTIDYLFIFVTILIVFFFTQETEEPSQKTLIDHKRLVKMARNYLKQHDEEESEECAVGRVWGNALKKLSADQKILAEKFINDILFEGKLGMLTRTSMKLNESYSSGTSSPVCHSTGNLWQCLTNMSNVIVQDSHWHEDQKGK